jgi:sporulation protein YlmC with PRC-barrel domain
MKIRSFLIAATTASLLAAPVIAQVTAPSNPAPTTTPSPMNAPTATTDVFYSDVWTPSHWRASETIGLAVYNRAGERIGEINDMLLDGSGRVMAAVVGVGGFLGIGERQVAVTFRSFEMTRESNGNPRLLVDLSKTVLQSAPEYKPAAKRS